LARQNKLHIGASTDPLEREADRIADEVAAAPLGPSKSGTVTRASPKQAAEDHQPTAPASVERVVASAGQALEPHVLGEMGQRFGHDFSRVRIHTGPDAERSAREIDASAYTVGDHVVVGTGQHASTRDGKRLLAHELTHVLQQPLGANVVRRQQIHGPKASATPSDWKDKVTNATASADRAALIQSVVSPVKVIDKTKDAASDTAVDPRHCIKLDDSNPTVSYDDGLNSKQGRAPDAGFTKETSSGSGAAKKTEFYIVLGPKVLDPKDLTTTTVILNHEFDHVRRTRAGSTQTGDESEIETWTDTFVHEFHLSYAIRDRSDGVTSYIDPGFRTFTQLGAYYARSTDATVKSSAVRQITDYYTQTIKPHPVHDKVFRYWIHRGINALGMSALCGDINDKLGKIVDPAKDVKDYWEMPTATVKAATFPGPPTVRTP
jgi:hypothetical protein